MKQTAVEWLEAFLLPQVSNDPIKRDRYRELTNRAKRMEKEQMMNLIKFLKTQDKMDKSIDVLYEQYQNEEYGKETDRS